VEVKRRADGGNVERTVELAHGIAGEREQRLTADQESAERATRAMERRLRPRGKQIGRTGETVPADAPSVMDAKRSGRKITTRAAPSVRRRPLLSPCSHAGTATTGAASAFSSSRAATMSGPPLLRGRLAIAECARP
jgi:hypothetical protein